ncbi:MAG: hypothetical protein IJF67_10770, partial [Clostridia bacterium]|nr:hypothetical protein [Clostridia bacterium]
MKKENKSVLSLMLLASLILASCGEAAAGSADTTAAGDTTTAAPETKAEIISNDLPEKDYGGFEFRMLTNDEVGNIRYSFELDSEAENGEVLNDAVFRRNQAVEEAYNITITQMPTNKNTFLSQFTASVMAGDDSYDVLVHTAEAIMKNGYLYGLSVDDLPYVDTSRDWWDTVIMEQAAIGGVNYGLSGDINLVDDYATWAIFFNKALAEENKVEDLYKLVYDGKWTQDVLRRICSDITRDINGDSTLDYQDMWGMVASGNSAGSMLWSAGGMLGTLGKDGALTLSVDSGRNVDALTKIFDVFSSGQVLITDRDIPNGIDGLTNWNYSYKIFSEGRTLFFGGCLSSLDYFRDMEDEFGYLPNPKFDENQKDYISTAQEWCATMFLVPKTAPDPERTSIILEAMASVAQHYITPAFYDVQLTRKYSRDDESEAILDILFENRVLDLVYTFNFGSARNIATAL